MAACDRVSPADAVIGPVPPFTARTPLTEMLAAQRSAPAPPDRNYAVEVETGVLVCGECARWYPIVERLPELLPDHLRDWTRDCEMLAGMTRLPRGLRDTLGRFESRDSSQDGGAHYKQAEIGIKKKIEDPAFFGPGYSSPFNLWNSDFTVYLIKVFGNVVPLLEAKPNNVIVDSGCGYAWTTEWLFKSGFEAVGVDICRAYLEVGVQRIGPFRPHLVIGDVEKLPLADACADGVLAYESFHHIPDRARAMAGFSRVLKEGGRVVLAEPGAEHDTADVSVEAMSKYGILEKGMELDDVLRYVEGTALRSLEQVHLLKVGSDDVARLALTLAPGWREVIEGNVFTLKKRSGATQAARREPLQRKTGDMRSPARSPASPAPRTSEAAVAVADPFDDYYFAKCCGRPYGRDEEWLTFFGGIADRIVTDIAPRRVLDAGCAMGLLVEALRSRGVEAYGVDISSYAIDRVHESVRPFCRLGSIVDPFPSGERYDLIVSIEVLEHMRPNEAERALDNICRHTDDVIFSSTPNDYREVTHVNVRSPEYWGEQFARRGFVRDVDFDATFVTPWGVRFRRSAEPLHRVIANYERRLSVLEAERGEVRSHSSEIQRELASALRGIDELRALNARLTAEWGRAQTELAVERDTVANMRRSAFWRARGVWVRIARLIGRPA